jgi:hypothetical protein
MKKIFYFLAFFFLQSSKCSKSTNTSIKVINKSIQLIDSVKVSSYGVNLTFKNMKPNDSLSQNALVDFQDYEGEFTIIIYQKDSFPKNGQFGYFSNEMNIKKEYRITTKRNGELQESN